MGFDLGQFALGMLLVLVAAMARGHAERPHRRTDPACSKYRAPLTALARWRFNRGRGKACPNCAARGPVCMNCSGPNRRTVGMICLECGRDYGTPAAS